MAGWKEETALGSFDMSRDIDSGGKPCTSDLQAQIPILTPMEKQLKDAN